MDIDRKRFFYLDTALIQSRENCSKVGRILEDCKRYLNAFQSYSVSHKFQEANNKHNYLAHFACNSALHNVFEKPLDLISKFCTGSRGYLSYF